MAQEAEDQLRRDAVARERIRHRVAEAADHDVEGDAARGVGLRIEEQLRVDDVVGVRAREVRHREGVEVAAVAQDGAAGVVEVEERLEVAEGVRGADRLHRRVGQGEAMLRREGEHQLGLERALDVQVELDLRQAADQALASGIDVHGHTYPLAGGARHG